jgi:large subunit ribosomal protein L6
MAVNIIETEVEIPGTVQLNLDGKKVTITGSKGKIEKNFSHTKLDLSHDGNILRIKVENPRKAEAALVGTISAHVKNMIKGVTEGYVYKMKIVFVHFPMTVKVQGKKIIIENFVGERKPRTTDIVGETKVTIKGDDITIEGTDLSEVSQTAANIQTATKIRNKDLRKFLDGIYVYSKE